MVAARTLSTVRLPYCWMMRGVRIRSGGDAVWPSRGPLLANGVGGPPPTPGRVS